ncbi:DUF6477 family protein [Meridianimarinicoccus roseus]|jgi:hypothetical protein|uniref:DUF6477 family protein n=1 Tax=Meridianimarinicoccus roseus TaxID=2072018 RepID=UPI001EE67691|nr:DUF6477 family protein [Meridianimarinicoccus roseus]
MNDPITLLKSLQRPALLVSAARHAAEGYQPGGPVLRRLLKGSAPAGPAEAVLKLLMLEGEMEDARRLRGAGYSAARHVTVLAALIGEGRGAADRTGPGQAKASATSSLRLAI